MTPSSSSSSSSSLSVDLLDLRQVDPMQVEFLLQQYCGKVSSIGECTSLQRVRHVVLDRDLPSSIRLPDDVGCSLWHRPKNTSWSAIFERECLKILAQRTGCNCVQSFDQLGRLYESAQVTPFPAVGSRTIGSQFNSDDPRPSLAMLTPLPPQRTGISDYVAALLPELAHHFQITLVNDDADVLPIWYMGELPMPVRRLDWFLENGSKFDHVVYQIGNSWPHEWMLQVLPIRPGVVVLHDSYISPNLYFSSSQGGGDSIYCMLARYQGYGAVKAVIQESNSVDPFRRWNLGLPVLQMALGVLVHSDHSLQLSTKCFPVRAHNWYRIPMLSRRPPALDAERCDSLYQRYGIESGTRMICSFGFVAPSKYSLELIQAFSESGLHREGWSLVLVGSVHAGEDYRSTLDGVVMTAGLEKFIHVTGWIDDDDYWCFQSLSGFNVQLRKQSRGESSAAVMDCLYSGKPLLVNRHGSLDELPDSICSKIGNKFTSQDLVSALRELALDGDYSRQLGAAATQFARQNHDPSICAEAYHNILEQIQNTSSHPLNVAVWLGVQIAFREQPRDERVRWMNELAQRLPLLPRQRRLFLDVSAVAECDLGTGVQRVVNNLARELLQAPPLGWRIEPVQATSKSEGYRIATEYIAQLLDIPLDDLPASDEIIPAEGDLFLGLDLSHDVVQRQELWYAKARLCGTRVWFVVYDLLPCLLPECFPPGIDRIHERWLTTILNVDGAICISRSVADELRAWFSTHSPNEILDSAIPHVDWFHQGMDFHDQHDTGQTLDNFVPREGDGRCCFHLLMVGTIEPRKGYLQALAAVEILLEQHVPISLTVVGHEGWTGLPNSQRRTIPQTVFKMRALAERYPDVVRWIQAASDHELKQCYQNADGLLAASYGEGFGLPLIEAASLGLPVLARNLPVFHEVMGHSATYFDATGPKDLAKEIRDWTSAVADKSAAGLRDWTIDSGQVVEHLTWEQSAQQLLKALGIISKSCPE